MGEWSDDLRLKNGPENDREPEQHGDDRRFGRRIASRIPPSSNVMTRGGVIAAVNAPWAE